MPVPRRSDALEVDEDRLFSASAITALGLMRVTNRAPVRVESIRERIAAIAGDFAIEPFPGRGTKLRSVFLYSRTEAIRPDGEIHENGIFLADDHPLIRDGLRLILGQQKDMTVVGEAGDGRDAVAGAPVCIPTLCCWT
jgi:hypothetical protein